MMKDHASERVKQGQSSHFELNQIALQCIAAKARQWCNELITNMTMYITQPLMSVFQTSKIMNHLNSYRNQNQSSHLMKQIGRKGLHEVQSPKFILESRETDKQSY